jgi:hypothetical protein
LRVAANRLQTGRNAISRYAGGAMTEDTRRFASSAQLWRLNTLGLIRLVDWPDEELEQPLERTEAKGF